VIPLLLCYLIWLLFHLELPHVLLAGVASWLCPRQLLRLDAIIKKKGYCIFLKQTLCMALFKYCLFVASLYDVLLKYIFGVGVN